MASSIGPSRQVKHHPSSSPRPRKETTLLPREHYAISHRSRVEDCAGSLDWLEPGKSQTSSSPLPPPLEPRTNRDLAIGFIRVTELWLVEDGIRGNEGGDGTSSKT